MPTNNRFERKFADDIVAVLDCHDRVIFKGYLPFYNDRHLNRWVDYGLKVRRKDFVRLVENQSDALVTHGKSMAETAGAPYEYRQGKFSKETLVRDIIQERGISEGLVIVLCVQETCRTVKLVHATGRPVLRFCRRPQRVLYYYFLDPDFGLMHVRIQTWFPFAIQVYVNGHDWLARQMAERKLGFVQHDNAFVELDDPEQAQQLADRFPKLNWVKQLRHWAGLVNPLLGKSWLKEHDYYWVIDQAELSTDVLFREHSMLQALYPRLLDHAVLNFSAQDLLRFLSRRLHPRFDGEVLTDCKKDRLPGARIKHRLKNNWLKMYDKFGLILRIETVINQPGEFRVRRLRMRKGCRQMVWCPMNKGVANFYQYHAVARAANRRYLDALAVVDLPATTKKNLDRACRPVKFHGRRRRGLNLLRDEEQQLFRAVLRGEHSLNGFRNRDLAEQLFRGKPRDPAAKRRCCAKISRMLQLLRAHGLIAKIPRSHRYRVTNLGADIMHAAVYLRVKAFPRELQNVA